MSDMMNYIKRELEKERQLTKNALITAALFYAGYEAGRAIQGVRLYLLTRKQTKLLMEQKLALLKAKEAIKVKIDRADVLFEELKDITDQSSPEYKIKLQELDALMTEIENEETELCNKLGVSKEEFFAGAV